MDIYELQIFVISLYDEIKKYKPKLDMLHGIHPTYTNGINGAKQGR